MLGHNGIFSTAFQGVGSLNDQLYFYNLAITFDLLSDPLAPKSGET